MIFRILYNISVRAYGLAIRIASWFNPKANLWIAGRNGWQNRLKQEMGKSGHNLIWLHAASVGEFEQGKPLLEAIKAAFPGYKILVTFFSPSGYEAAKGNKLSDFIFYLPLDTPSNAKCFVEIVNPKLVIWVKYEYWWNHLEAISKRKIPLLLVSAIFQERQPFFKWFGSWHRTMLNVFTRVFVQNEASKTLLADFFPEQKVQVSGDTRFDRVKNIADNWTPIPLVENWIGPTQWVIVAGSTWLDDEKLLRHIIREKKNIKWIIAPHKIDKVNTEDTLNILPDALKFSDLESNINMADSGGNLLLMDTMGMLSRLYKYGTICFIGGGFSATGIHNTLEASIYGKPILFGPEYEEYAEAVSLVKAGGAIPVENVLELEREISALISDPEKLSRCAQASFDYTMAHTGATQKIMDYIYRNRLLTNE